MVSQHKSSVCSHVLAYSKKYKEKEHGQHPESLGGRTVGSAFINLALDFPLFPRHMILLETEDQHFFPYLKTNKQKTETIYSLQNTGMEHGEKKKKKSHPNYQLKITTMKYSSDFP